MRGRARRATAGRRRDRLGIYGGSNGGLLVGAALTQRPSAYAAVVCSAPLLDMVRYEQFGLGRTWNDEYGTAADPDGARLAARLLALPPRRATATAYPAVLFTVFDGDSRVDPLHARKLCAALQAATTADAPVLLRAERDVGHGARAVSRTVALSVDVLAFLAAHTGLALQGVRAAAGARGPPQPDRRRARRPRSGASSPASAATAAGRGPRLPGRCAARSTGSSADRVRPAGRRDADLLRPGDPVDSWLVEQVEPGRRLVLRSRMRLPGTARLELVAVEPAPDGRSRLVQRVEFVPSGRAGTAYWGVVAPLHRPVFARLLAGLARAAERAARDLGSRT